MYLRKVFPIFAFTLQSCSFPLDFLKRSEHIVIRARASYSVVDVDGNQASTSTYSTSPVFETVIQTIKSKYPSTTLTTNEPAGSRATKQGLTEILSATSLTVSRSKTICSDSTLVRASAVPVSTESALPPNPSYFIVNPEGTQASPNIAIATTTITIKNDLRPYNTASALLPNFTNTLIRILSSASPVATAKSVSTTPASKLPSNTSKRLKPSSIAISVYEPTGNPSTSYDRVTNAPYRFPNITSTTSAGWNTEVRVALVDSGDS